jgi:osmotically-inducible protein OsmY
MTRSRSASLLALSFTLAGPLLARGQLLNPQPSPVSAQAGTQTQVVTKTLDMAIAESLAGNPVTAPFRIGVASRNGKLVLTGRVGSSYVHDAAVRTAIAYGASVSDQLVIDTTGAYPLNPPAGAVYAGPAGQRQNPVGTLAASYGPAAQGSVLTSYTYPPPLFGRYDEPFFGLEPPLSSFPAWWGEMSRYRLAQNAGPPAPTTQQANLAPNTVEATIDPTGVAILRGTVPFIEDKIGAELRLSQTPGVSQIINRVNVDPSVARVVLVPVRRPGLDDEPPPPPTPSLAKPVPTLIEPGGMPIRPAPEPPRPGGPGAAPAPAPPTLQPPAAATKPGMLGRIDRAIQDRPELTGKPIKIAFRDGVAYLSGKVPTVFEAMLAFRAVQQTPGVNAVVDSLEFFVPDGTAPHPWLRANAEDVEPYLEAQIRRQVGDIAHLDRVRLSGDQLQIIGTLERADDRPRVEAILRSMPLLRGFKMQPEFRPLDR